MSATPDSSLSVTLIVSGVHCASCVALLEEVLADTPGVLAAGVDLEAKTARVSFDPSVVTVDALCAATEAVGYPAFEDPASA